MKVYISSENKNGRVAYVTDECFIYNFFIDRGFKKGEKKETNRTTMFMLKHEMKKEKNQNNDFERGYANFVELLENDIENDDIIEIELR